ncbi:MAG: L-lactate permease [Anaerolineae bacterium]
MQTLPITLLNWLLALSPIAVVLILMVRFRWGGVRAGPVGWFTAVLVAVRFFGAGPRLLAYSQLKGVLLTLYVLYIIWMALVLYHVVDEAGAISVIGAGIARLTGDRVMQLLILGWVFSSFLQGVAGFGVPIAVVAPLLIGLGFSPPLAVAAVAIGHSWSVTFGDIASSFQALIAATGLSGLQLAPWSAFFLGAACFGCGLATAHLYQGSKGVRHALAGIVIIGVGMSLTQYLLAVNGLWNLAGFVAGMVGLVIGAVVSRLPLYRGARPIPSLASAPGTANMSLLLATAAYLILIIVVSAAELYGPLHRLLNLVAVRVSFPELVTAYGWHTVAGSGKAISLFGHAGALLAYTSLMAYGIYRAAGRYQPGTVGRILSRTLRSAVPSSIGIVSMVGFAVVMDHSGMTYLLAQGISRTVGTAFPFFSPLVGTLGVFMTGSNTNSNVIFAPLQKSTAELVGLSVLVILGAQTTGGALGSMLAPAKIIVGCSTAGLAGQEGQVLRRTLVYGLVIAALIGLLAWLAA